MTARVLRRLGAALLLAGATVAHGQALQPRDYNGDGSIDAFYEVSANLTWLADADYAATQGIRFRTSDNQLAAGLGFGPGEIIPVVTNLEIFGFTGWRLPESTFYGSSACPFFTVNTISPCGYYASPDDSEFAHLLFTTLGGSPGHINTGPFLNVRTDYLYAGMPAVWGDIPGAGTIRSYQNMTTGRSMLELQGLISRAWIVHEGDLSVAAPVPEPSTYALMLAGLVGVAAVVRRGRQAATS